MKTVLSLLIVVFSIFGILDAGYITYEKLSGKIPQCGAGFDCGGVLESPWAYIGPIPLSVYGLFFYATVFIVAVLNVLEVNTQQPLSQISKKLSFKIPPTWLTPPRLLLVLTTFGFFFSLYLVSLMAFVIQAWCLYCLLSAATCVSLFITAGLLNRVDQETHA